MNNELWNFVVDEIGLPIEARFVHSFKAIVDAECHSVKFTNFFQVCLTLANGIPGFIFVFPNLQITFYTDYLVRSETISSVF